MFNTGSELTSFSCQGRGIPARSLSSEKEEGRRLVNTISFKSSLDIERMTEILGIGSHRRLS